MSAKATSVGVAVALLFFTQGAARPAGRPQAQDLAAARRNLMPLPAEVSFRGRPLRVEGAFRIALVGEIEPRLVRAARRLLERLGRQVGTIVAGTVEVNSAASGAHLIIECYGAAGEVQDVAEDESYTLDVDGQSARLRASSPYGVLRGMETFLQLVEAGPGVDGSGPTGWDFQVPGVEIRDAPRFPWRGLLVDPGRHFLPVEVIKRNLDAMAAVKLNVLHWHLTEDQGFRIESRVFPRLHELGSDGLYYTQEQVREIVEYARDRGVRVMPEFDMPGHSTSWLVGYPELASAPGPYEIIRTWGIQDPAMDPTREETYEFLDRFIAEMAALLPDPYFHIGGDEVRGTHWDENPRIQRFIEENDLGDNHGLQAYFNRRVQSLLDKHGKKMVGWDEILHPDLPKDIVVQSWRGQESLAEGARRGYQGILSNGWYLDLVYPAAQHYAVDPLGEGVADLSAEERARILGGEACMWGEYVSGETIDSRIWPRAAAIAERLWSPRAVTQVDDMYRRLEATSQWLEWTGVTHRSSYDQMLSRLTGGQPIEPLRTLADVLEPVRDYRRGRTREYTSRTPLNRLVDATRPESDVAREFLRIVERLIADPGSSRAGPELDLLAHWLTAWRANHELLLPILRASPMLDEAEPLSRNLADLAEIADEALAYLLTSGQPSEADASRYGGVLERASEQHGALRIMLVDAVERLVEAARTVRNSAARSAEPSLSAR